MKIKVLIKRPDEEYGHMTWISNTLKNLQSIVGGYIEVTAPKRDFVIICNEDGKNLGLEPNIFLGGDMIVGTIIVCGTKDDEFCNIPITFDRWKRIVDMSGTKLEKEIWQSN
jgi:hypothetical protein